MTFVICLNSVMINLLGDQVVSNLVFADVDPDDIVFAALVGPCTRKSTCDHNG